MVVTALVPMKAHSSRVPNKNFREICGRPLFEWILGTVLQTNFVDKVQINTDALQELSDSELIRNDRVLLRERPAILRGDEVSMNLVINDDLESTGSDHYMMTHTTNPAISVDTLNAAFESYLEGLEQGHDSLFSVNRHQTRFYSEQCSPINHDPNNLIPTQELDVWFEENSCVYFFNKSSFSQTNARIGKNPKMHVTPKLESCDIDEWEDWHFAEVVLRSATGEQGA